MIEIDGSIHEGGGQMLRTALALSALTNTSFIITNIRKNRKECGLKTQHLKCVEAVKKLCCAETIGEYIGSTKLTFIPKKLDFQNINIDIGTAGSITLLLQSILPFALFSNKKLKIQIHGGTDTLNSMPIDYFSSVFMPHFRKYCDYELLLEKRGYYPKGGGKITLKIKPKYPFEGSFPMFYDYLRKQKLAINLTSKGKLLAVKGKCHASKDLMAANVAERIEKAAKFELNEYNPEIEISYGDALSIGCGITLYALFSDGDELDFNNPVIIGADSLGEKGKKSEEVGKEAAQKLKKLIKTNSPVDDYLIDQLLPYLAIFGGRLKYNELTGHAKSNIYIIEKFLGKKFKIENNEISC